MIKNSNAINRSQTIVALTFFEGDTEIVFFKKVFEMYVRNIPRKLFNLRGNYNIQGKILDRTFNFLDNNKHKNVRIYCFIDRESRTNNPPLDISILKEEFIKNKVFEKEVLSIEATIATPMIESWFFHDIEGIYTFLKAPKSQRNPNKYKTVGKFDADDLSKLFKRYKKFYIKGKRCSHFIDNLDIEKIYMNCDDLKAGIDSIISDFS